MPNTRRRVVCGLSDTIATFPPQSAFTSVDFPTFGRPATATKPLFIPLPALSDVAASSPHPQRVGVLPLTLSGERTARKRTRACRFCANCSREVPRVGKQLRRRIDHDL